MYVLDGAKVFGVFGVCIVLYLIRGNKHSQFGREGGKKETEKERTIIRHAHRHTHSRILLSLLRY